MDEHEITAHHEEAKREEVDPYIFKAHYGVYLITSHRISNCVTLQGHEVCYQCRENPVDPEFKLGDYGECIPNREFCSKKCLCSYLKGEPHQNPRDKTIED